MSNFTFARKQNYLRFHEETETIEYPSWEFAVIPRLLVAQNFKII